MRNETPAQRAAREAAEAAEREAQRQRMAETTRKARGFLPVMEAAERAE